MIFYKESKSNKKSNSGGWEVRGRGVATVSVFFYFFSKDSKSEKKCFFFEGMKVREDWLV